MISVVPPARRPRCDDDCWFHHSYRSALALADDLAAAWAAVADDPTVDVGGVADRHIAGARVGRAMCVRLGRMFGHRVPATVVPCAMSVRAVRDGRELRYDADDHLLLITDRAFVDLGLARCRSALPAIAPVACAERVVGWPAESTVLLVIVGDVTVRYRLADHAAYRRSPLWRRTNREWNPILERVGAEIDRLWKVRGAYSSRPPLGVLAGVADRAADEVGADTSAAAQPGGR